MAGVEPVVIIANDFFHVHVIDGDRIKVQERVPFVIGGFKWMTVFEGDLCDPALGQRLTAMQCAHDALAARIERVARRRIAAEDEEAREAWHADVYR